MDSFQIRTRCRNRYTFQGRVSFACGPGATDAVRGRPHHRGIRLLPPDAQHSPGRNSRPGTCTSFRRNSVPGTRAPKLYARAPEPDRLRRPPQIPTLPGSTPTVTICAPAAPPPTPGPGPATVRRDPSPRLHRRTQPALPLHQPGSPQQRPHHALTQTCRQLDSDPARRSARHSARPPRRDRHCLPGDDRAGQPGSRVRPAHDRTSRRRPRQLDKAGPRSRPD